MLPAVEPLMCSYGLRVMFRAVAARGSVMWDGVYVRLGGGTLWRCGGGLFLCYGLRGPVCVYDTWQSVLYGA